MLLSQHSWMAWLSEFFKNDPNAVCKGFETDFLTDVLGRFDEEGDQMFVSGPMMNVMRRIGNARFGMLWTDYLVDDDMPNVSAGYLGRLD